MTGADLPLPHCEKERALHAVDKLRAAHPRASSVADALERAIHLGRVTEHVFIQHSRWCNTEGSWSAGVGPARDAAFAMYGFVPDRLQAGDGAQDDAMKSLLAEYRRRLQAS